MSEQTLDPALQSQVDQAAASVEARCAADPDLVHGDVVEELALELPLEVAVALCRQQMGFLPDTLRQRVFEHENADVIAAHAAVTAERDAAEAKARARTEKAAATRKATLAREAEAEKVKIKSKTCPDCFQVRSAAGVCGCD